MKIWVDDIRTAPDGWVWCKTSRSAIDMLTALEVATRLGSITEYGKPTLMSLDHDLGGDDTTRPVVLWMCENDFWPEKVVVHSSNPVGIEWLEGMISRYKP
jgi:hypothetical protein